MNRKKLFLDYYVKSLLTKLAESKNGHFIHVAQESTSFGSGLLIKVVFTTG